MDKAFAFVCISGFFIGSALTVAYAKYMDRKRWQEATRVHELIQKHNQEMARLRKLHILSEEEEEN